MAMPWVSLSSAAAPVTANDLATASVIEEMVPETIYSQIEKAMLITTAAPEEIPEVATSTVVEELPPVVAPNVPVNATRAIITAPTANLRSGSSSKKSKIATLYKDTVVQVIAVEEDFVQVSFGDKTGFVNMKYVKETTKEIIDTTPVNTVSNDTQPIITPSSENSNTILESSDLATKMIDYSKQFIGVPYRRGGTTPNGFDCSGFTSYVYKNSGINIPRTASAQYASSKKITKENLAPGDLVFFNCSGSGISHVGMYIGNGNMIHSPNTGSRVEIKSITKGYFSSRFVGGGRYL